MTVTMEVLSARNLHMFHRSSAVSTSRFDGFSHVCPPCKNQLRINLHNQLHYVCSGTGDTKLNSQKPQSINENITQNS